MRRHSSVVETPTATTSNSVRWKSSSNTDTYGIRRRLFQSPRKRSRQQEQQLKQRYAILPSLFASSFVGTARQSNKFSLSCKTITFVGFGYFAIIIIFGIYIILYNAVQVKFEGNALTTIDEIPINSMDNSTTMKAHTVRTVANNKERVTFVRKRNDTNQEKLPMTTSTKTNITTVEKQQQQYIPQINLTLTELQPLDYEKYTIRINTWKRQEQLLVSIDHHLSCDGVAQIQVVWCIDQGDEPPIELINHPDVVIERHSVNSLNERFNILSSTPTLGILSIDDDVLRPCTAIDSGFFKWTKSPHRMVGFDARTHVENEDGSWMYGYMSTMEKTNHYSLSLTRYSFLHRDYLDWYINYLPKPIVEKVAKAFNCEDIAMSFMISSLTDGRPSLLADYWAIKSMVKVFSEDTISGSSGHKAIRDECVDTFATILGLKEDNGSRRLQMAEFVRTNNSMFESGISPEVIAVPSQNENHINKCNREIEFEMKLSSWRNQEGGAEMLRKNITIMMARTGFRAYQRGLIVNTDKWKERFNHT